MTLRLVLGSTMLPAAIATPPQQYDLEIGLILKLVFGLLQNPGETGSRPAEWY